MTSAWHRITAPPDSERRVLVAHDDGYIEMAFWNGSKFEHDWPMAIVGATKLSVLMDAVTTTASVPRAKYWCDLPIPPTQKHLYEENT